MGWSHAMRHMIVAPDLHDSLWQEERINVDEDAKEREAETFLTQAKTLSEC